MNNSIQVPLSVKIWYALGQVGSSISTYCVVYLMTYFYLPPESGNEAIFPPFIYQGAVFGVLTIIGLVGASSRLFDAVIDPMIASLSDGSTARMGKRRIFLAIGALPTALFSFLVYLPPSQNMTLNALWLIICAFLFFVFMTCYVVPYNTLVSELGHTPKEQLQLSSMIGSTWIVGFLTANTVFIVQGYLEQTMSSVQAFQTAVGMYNIIAFVFMLLPVLFLDEQKYCRTIVSTLPFYESVKSVFANRNFRVFAFSLALYWTCITFISLGGVYYVTVLLEADKSHTTFFQGAGLAVGLFLYPVLYKLAYRYGKKRMLSYAFLVLTFILGSCAFLGNVPVPIYLQLYVLPLLTAFPFACVGVVSSAMIAEMIIEEEKRTGSSQPAMYYATRTFMSKLGMSLGTIIFPSLLLLGKSTDNDLGIRLTGIVAALLCFGGYWLLRFYKEPAEENNI